MTIKSMKYNSEEEARKASEKALVRFGKKHCTVVEEKRAIVITRPDRMDGTITARYEW